MSLIKISTIPVETFLYEDTQAPVALWTFDQYPEVHLTARWDPDRPYGRRGEKLSDKVYVWTPRKKEIPGLFKLPLMGRPRRGLLNGAAGLPLILAADVYEIRKRFFEIANPEQGHQFFTQYGIFGQEHRNSFAFLVGLSFADLLQWKELLKKCWLAEPSEWEAFPEQYAGLQYAPDILKAPELSIGLEVPIRIRLLCECVRDAIMAAIYLDKLANVKSSMCHRPDCRVVFNHESGHQRKYCSSDCAHIEAVRNSRLRKAGK
jgi:hypothetical protein